MSSDQSNHEYDIPPVIPLTQMETKDDGTSIAKRVRPLTYALISFIKNILDQPDTVNISDDEMEGEWNYQFTQDEDGDDVYSLFFNTYEEKENVTLDIYLPNLNIDNVEEELLNAFIIQTNLQLKIGQIQRVNNTLRFHSSLALEGIASKDPEYSGPHLISPKLFSNMFNYAIDVFPHIVNEIENMQE
jgi:hypothetical protein